MDSDRVLQVNAVKWFAAAKFEIPALPAGAVIGLRRALAYRPIIRAGPISAAELTSAPDGTDGPGS